MGSAVSGGLVDLHTHSCFSDGTMTPQALLEDARRRGVTVLAVTDHDVLEGARVLQILGEGSGVRCVAGVELDVVEQGVNLHILGYGMDLDDPEFGAFCRENRARLEEVNRKLIAKMEAAGEPVTLAEYDAFTYDPKGGGWTALHYFLQKGLSHSLMGGMALYKKFEHAYTCVDFPSVAQVAGHIHGAGGLAVLAHPGEVIPTGDLERFQGAVREIMGKGLDGLECHYAFHAPAVTELCLALCRAEGWLVTCGSDCHGSFGFSEVGQLSVEAEQLPELKKILETQEKVLRKKANL